ILEFFSTCRIEDEMGLDVAETLCFQMGGARRSMTDFLRGAPSYTYIRNLVRRLCHRLISYIISERGQAPEKVTATDLFYLHSMDREAANVPYLLAYNDGLRGLSVVARELPLIDMVAEDAPTVDEGDQAILAPVHAPQ
ncbi:hypothetical protein Tco_1100994, partial [Tanacetum coccineum]